MKGGSDVQSLVNYALKYAEKGFYVLPVSILDKRPLIEFADRPAMPADQIKRIWKRHPNAQIAFRTVDFLVVDIDNHTDGANGLDSFKKCKNKHPEWFPETLSQTTHSGGQQLFYQKPRGLEMTQTIGWLPGVDIKAHPNNYAVVAPSQGAKGKYHWNNKLPIVQAPQELVDAILNRQNEFANDNSYNGSDDKYGNLTPQEVKMGQHSKTAELFEQVVNGFGITGGRNMALASFVGGLLFRNVDAEVVYKLSVQANENTNSPLGAKEFNRTFDSMVKKELRRRKNA